MTLPNTPDTQPVEPTTTPPEAPPQEPDVRFKDDPTFGHMRDRINDLQKQMADQAEKQKAAEEAAHNKQLEAEGRWQERATLAETKLEAAQAAHAAEYRHLTLKAGLAGIENDFARDGAIAKCPADVEPDVYIAELKEKHPELFKSPASPRTPAQGMPSGGTQNSLEDRLKTGDPRARKEALSKILSGGTF